MASFFHLDSATPTAAPEEEADDAQSRAALAGEVSELRTQIARLVEEMARVVPRENEPPDTPP